MNALAKKVAQYGLAAIAGHELSQALTPQKETVIEKTVYGGDRDVISETEQSGYGNNGFILCIALIAVILMAGLAACILRMLPQRSQERPTTL